AFIDDLVIAFNDNNMFYKLEDVYNQFEPAKQGLEKLIDQYSKETNKDAHIAAFTYALTKIDELKKNFEMRFTPAEPINARIAHMLAEIKKLNIPVEAKNSLASIKINNFTSFKDQETHFLKEIKNLQEKLQAYIQENT